MYITLTNSTPAHRGQKLAINSVLIATIHNSSRKRETGETENVTFVFCPPHGTWEVTESLEEVVNELNNAAWNNK
jgi:hypothetical protein